MIENLASKQLRGTMWFLLLVGLSCVWVAFAQSDNSPPQLISFDFNPKTVDISHNDVEVIVTGRVTDETGVEFVGAAFLKGTGWINACSRMSFSGEKTADFTSRCTMRTNYDTYAGTWPLQIHVKDVLGNEYKYQPGAYLTVIHDGAPSSDLDPPAMESLDFSPKTVDVTDGSVNINLTARFSDESGVSRIVIGFANSGSGGCIRSFSASYAPTELDVNCTLRVDTFFTAGEWYLRVYVRDIESNSDTYRPSTALTVINNASTDTTPPVLNLPGTQIVQAHSPTGSFVTLALTATDDTDPSPIVTCTPPSGSKFPIGITTVQCTATDASGNSTSGSFHVQVHDTLAPILSMPANIIAEARRPAGASISYSVSASDPFGADPSPVISCNPPSGSVFQLGTTIITCTATDFTGNSSSDSFTITVNDTTPPTLTLPSDITVDATDANGAVVSFAVSASDQVDLSPDVSCSPASESTFPVGITTVLCTATDDSGNSTSDTFTITVNEAAPPPQTQTIRLSIAGSGTGGGSISGPGISCNVLPGGHITGICILATSTTPVTMSFSASASAESTFRGWQGCDQTTGPGNEHCQVTLESADRVLTAIFAREGSEPTLYVGGMGTGSGRISGSGINCNIAPGGGVSGDCTLTASNPPLGISLTASAGIGSTLEGWNDCDSTSGVNNEICHVTLNLADRTVFATFSEVPATPEEQDQTEPPDQSQEPEEQGPIDEKPADLDQREWRERFDMRCLDRQEVSITFGEEIIEDCIYVSPGGGDSDIQQIYVGDPPEAAWRSGGGERLPAADGNQLPDLYLKFNVDDNFMYEGQPSHFIKIEIEYFDDGFDYFRILYEAYRGASGGGRFTQADPEIRESNSQRWRTATFLINNAFFSNGQQGGDFWIDDWGDGSIIIRKLTISFTR